MSASRIFATGVVPHGWKKELLKLSADQERQLSKFCCWFCKHGLMRAVMTECCGTRYCAECYKFSQEKLPRRMCPTCKHEDSEINNDSRVRKWIDTLEGSCIFPGCSIKDQIARLDIHIGTCPHGLADCPRDCGRIIQRSSLASHDLECEKNVTTCPHCGQRIHQAELKKHVEHECAKSPLECEHCTKKFPRQDLTAHMRSEHPEALRQSATEMRSRIQQVQGSFNATSLSTVSWAELQIAYQELFGQLNLFEVSKKQIGQFLAASPDDAIITHAIQHLTVSDAAELHQLVSRIDELQQGIATQKELVVAKFDQICEDDKREEDAQKALDAIKAEIANCRERILAYNKNLVVVDRDVQFQELSTKDGVFLWKIENWPAVVETAKNSEPPYISSPCFYSSPSGYRLRVRLFPNGDREQRGKGISVYIVIMRGPYDPILRWPFDKQVLISLVDQSAYLPSGTPSPGSPPPGPPERADFTCVIRPDVTKPSQRDACKMPPRDRDGNAAIGFVKFIDHQQMEHPQMRMIPVTQSQPGQPQQQVTPKYIFEDTIFIRVLVEPLDKGAASSAGSSSHS